MIRLLDVDYTTHLSDDSVETEHDGERLNFSIEFLNSINASGMPQNRLRLKYVFLNILTSENNYAIQLKRDIVFISRKLFIGKTVFKIPAGNVEQISITIKEDFKIDEADLKNKFRKMQTLIHPDKYIGIPIYKYTNFSFTEKSTEKSISEEYSSLLNKAYNVLQTPLKRAEHLLELKGAQVGESDKIDDPEFLLEMMSLNEEVEEAGNDKQILKKLFDRNKSVISKLEKEIEENFISNNIETTKKNVIRLKYFMSIHNRINKVLRELGVTD
nr:unnamed protein product [Callosobruchus analis]